MWRRGSMQRRFTQHHQCTQSRLPSTATMLPHMATRPAVVSGPLKGVGSGSTGTGMGGASSLVPTRSTFRREKPADSTLPAVFLLRTHVAFAYQPLGGLHRALPALAS